MKNFDNIDIREILLTRGFCPMDAIDLKCFPGCPGNSVISKYHHIDAIWGYDDFGYGENITIIFFNPQKQGQATTIVMPLYIFLTRNYSLGDVDSALHTLRLRYTDDNEFEDAVVRFLTELGGRQVQ